MQHCATISATAEFFLYEIYFLHNVVSHTHTRTHTRTQLEIKSVEAVAIIPVVNTHFTGLEYHISECLSMCVMH